MGSFNFEGESFWASNKIKTLVNMKKTHKLLLAKCVFIIHQRQFIITWISITNCVNSGIIRFVQVNIYKYSYGL